VYGGRGEYIDVDKVKPAAETDIVELRIIVGDCVKVEIRVCAALVEIEIKDVVGGGVESVVAGLTVVVGA
jgi:hypothetical protein